MLTRRGKHIAWFADDITIADAKHLGFEWGTSSSPQACEALAVLVGTRIWTSWWTARRCAIALKGDNITALTTGLTLRAPKGAVKHIARELALDFADAPFEPFIGEHIPGISNILADVLSRRCDPAHAADWQLPRELLHVPPGTRSTEGCSVLAFVMRPRSNWDRMGRTTCSG